jgi:DNA-binding IclR family transcriptional regulator
MLGYGLFELGLTAATQFRPREICGPSLARIAAQTGFTAFMTIRSQSDAISIAKADANEENAVDLSILEIGAHRPLGVGAGSLALLISLPDDEIERIVFSNARRLSVFGKLTVPLLMQITREAQETGYAVHDSRMISGISGVGILVRDSAGAPLGAISVSAKAESLSLEAQVKILGILRKESRVLQNLIHQANIDVAEYCTKRVTRHRLGVSTSIIHTTRCPLHYGA